MIQVRVLLGPVADRVGTGQVVGQIDADIQRLVHVMQFQAHAGDAIDAQYFFQIGHVGVGHAAVDLVVTGFEDAAHGEAFHARDRADRRALHFGQRDQHGIADADT
ncbi:hypothetical protein D3C71_1321080 [compost metagenome]